MTITPDTLVAAIATGHPATVRVFQRHGIDFCCGGGRPLRAACAEHGVTLEILLADLQASIDDRSDGDFRDWRTAPLTDLVTHILVRYHEPQRAELPRLEAMMDKVVSVHGDRWPDMLRPLASTFAQLKAEAESHTENEEARVFPAILALEPDDGPDPDEVADRAILDLEREHARMGARLAEITRLTAGFRPPDGACNTFLGLFHGLHELSDALQEHVHLENHVLFPRAAALAAARRASAADRP